MDPDGGIGCAVVVVLDLVGFGDHKLGRVLSGGVICRGVVVLAGSGELIDGMVMPVFDSKVGQNLR